MDKSDCLGSVIIDTFRRRAKIMLLEARDRTEEHNSVEATLVHELMHIVIPAYDLGIPRHDTEDAGTPQYILYERIIDQMTGVLMKAYYGN